MQSSADITIKIKLLLLGCLLASVFLISFSSVRLYDRLDAWVYFVPIQFCWSTPFEKIIEMPTWI
jgi:hypothetical protein